MTNRERISQMSMYDFLAKLNNAMQSPAVGVSNCIYNAFGHTAGERVDRCAEYNHSCSQCLQKYLEEEAE